MIKKLLILLFLILTPAIGFSATYTVTQTGAGANYSAAEFNSLSGSKAGDTFCFSGTFTSSLDASDIYGTSGNPVVLDGYCTNDTTYAGISESSGRAKIDTNGSGNGIDLGNYTILKDFEITDIGTGTSNEAVDNNSGVHDIKIYRVYVHEVREGFYNGIGTYNVLIEDCVGKNVGWTTADATAMNNGSHDIIYRNNHFYANSANWGIDGIQITNAGTAPYDFLIEGNSIHGHKNDDTDSIHGADGEKGEDGIDMKYGAYNVIVRRNKIFDNGAASSPANINLSNGGKNHIYIYENYVYGAKQSNISGQSSQPHTDINIFSNIIASSSEGGGIFGASTNGSGTGYRIWNNTFYRNGVAPEENYHTGIYIVAPSMTNWAKNNIFISNRPNESDYRQMYINANSDTNMTADYDIYYWPSHSSTVYWGDAGSKTIAQLQSLGGSYGNQEVHGSDADPGLTNVATGDFTIVDTDSNAYNAGVDVSVGTLATLTINGETVPIYDYSGIGPNTTWGSDSQLPSVEDVNRETYQWDAGAYVYVGGAPPADTDPPTPDPATWQTEPTADSTSAISMEATTGSDASPPISYQFILDPESDDCAGAGCSSLGTGGTSSGWQSADTTYTDSGLGTNLCYCYGVQMKDSEGNEGTVSAPFKRATLADTPGAPTLDNATDNTIDISEVDEGTNTAGTWLAGYVTSTDPAWNGKYVNKDTGAPSDTASWQAFETWDATETMTSLQSGTEYCVSFKAINQQSVQTNFGAEACLSTTGSEPAAPRRLMIIN